MIPIIVHGKEIDPSRIISQHITQPVYPEGKTMVVTWYRKTKEEIAAEREMLRLLNRHASMHAQANPQWYGQQALMAQFQNMQETTNDR